MEQEIIERIEKRNGELYANLVPMTGKCDTLGGELLRAANRIAFRWLNDGDRAGVGYGRETVNPAVRFLSAVCDRERGLPIEFEKDVMIMQNFVDAYVCILNDETYTHLVYTLVGDTIEAIERGGLDKVPNEYGDMLDYAEECDTDDDLSDDSDDEDERWDN